ncbi:MAG: hypothetical protein A3F75_13515 [Betaproteobacteria bacterium RIFCSPLOWO2_12_FULL_64_23]|nr:MAG: hypothetical protein A3F75_13515 [Betaproteobacteria bacterium RIFCSPLOWO2_12_FULL_64_23]
MSTRTVQLEEVAKVFNGKTPSKAEQRHSGHPVLKIKDVDETGQFVGRFDSFVDPNFAANLPGKTIRAGDTLILNAAHNAVYVASKSFFAHGAAVGALATGEWLLLRPIAKQADARFIFYWSQYSETRKKLGGLVKGIHLYPKDVAELPILLPELSEQKRIAVQLEQADRLRGTRRHALELSDTFLPAVFRELFGDPIKNDKGWHVAALGDYIDFLTSGSRGWAPYYAEQGDVFIRIQNVGRGRMLLDDLTYVAAPRNAEATRTLVKSGDVLLSITADLGRSAAIPDGFPPAYVNQHLAIIRQTELNPVFLATLLSCDAAQAKWGTIDRSAVKSGLNFDDIRGFHVIAPPMSSQQHFAELVARHERLKAGQLEALRQADHMFQTLLYRAFESKG